MSAGGTSLAAREGVVAYYAALAEARADDLRILADRGETRESAARSLGVGAGALYRWCLRRGRLDLWARLA